MSEKMRTICAGRHLLDVPERADVSLSGESIAGCTIDTVEETATAFRIRLAARETAIGARDVDVHAGGEDGLIAARDPSLPSPGPRRGALPSAGTMCPRGQRKRYDEGPCGAAQANTVQRHRRGGRTV